MTAAAELAGRLQVGPRAGIRWMAIDVDDPWRGATAETDATHRDLSCSIPRSGILPAARMTMCSLSSGPVFRLDNPIPPRIALGFVTAQRRPVAPGYSVEVPYNFSVAHGQLAFQFLCPLHARAIDVDKPIS